MNPLNPEAGDTPAPSDPKDLAAVERSAKIIWRAFPYFAWRYGERGASFGRSDAGFLVTLANLDHDAALWQVLWLARLLAARGMPSLLLEYQLESLGRVALRGQRPGASRLRTLAEHLRRGRLAVLDASVADECEQLCWTAARRDRRRVGAGHLIASAVADRVLGLGEHDQALVHWLSGTEPEDRAWARACTAARALADARLPPGGRPEGGHVA